MINKASGMKSLTFISLFLVLLTWQCKTSDIDDYTQIIANRKAEIESVLSSSLPVILLNDNDLLTIQQQQQILANQIFHPLYSEKNSPMLNEVFNISILRPSDITSKTSVCKTKECLRLELYNYAKNGMTVITIVKDRLEVLDIQYYPEMQGEINQKLSQLAVAIALTDTTVTNAYGEGIEPDMVRMQATKTALNRTKCQRSEHLCLAPTFVKDDRALWSIVDITELKVVGVKWTNVGRTGMPVSERSVQNDEIMKCYCDVENSMDKDGWKFKYNLTRSDGLKVYEVSYKNQPIYKSIKVVDWHVSYSNTQGFGYSDAIGCPEFSQAAVVAIEKPVVEAILSGADTLGFKLVQRYFSEGWPTPCSYNYQQEFHFFRDGSMRPVIGSIGRGCGNDGTYRPVTRISFYGEEQAFYSMNPDQMKEWSMEGWKKENDIFNYIDGKYLGEVQLDNKNKLKIEANKGQFGDSGRGDNAWIYITVDHPDKDEGEADLPTLGPCCNIDHRQGPEKFIESESLDGQDIVLWYVPELKNDDRPGNEYCWAESILENGIYVPKIYPCFSGPKLVLN